MFCFVFDFVIIVKLIVYFYLDNFFFKGNEFYFNCMYKDVVK